MARTIEAVFESFYTADLAVRELRESGFTHDAIDIFSRCQPAGENSLDLDLAVTDHRPTLMTRAAKSEILLDGQGAGARVGASVGSGLGLTGALLAAGGVLPVPGLAPGLAAAAAAGLALTLTALLAGSLLGRLLGLAIPEQEIREYAKNIHKGAVIVSVLADWNRVDPVLDLLNRHNPLEVKEITASWTQRWHGRH